MKRLVVIALVPTGDDIEMMMDDDDDGKDLLLVKDAGELRYESLLQ